MVIPPPKSVCLPRMLSRGDFGGGAEGGGGRMLALHKRQIVSRARSSRWISELIGCLLTRSVSLKAGIWKSYWNLRILGA